MKFFLITKRFGFNLALEFVRLLAISYVITLRFDDYSVSFAVLLFFFFFSGFWHENILFYSQWPFCSRVAHSMLSLSEFGLILHTTPTTTTSKKKENSVMFCSVVSPLYLILLPETKCLDARIKSAVLFLSRFAFCHLNLTE